MPEQKDKICDWCGMTRAMAMHGAFPPDFVMHAPTPECSESEPHLIDSCGRFEPKGERVVAPQLLALLTAKETEIARLRDILTQANQQLVYWWNFTSSCPCGARKESPTTHHHASGCPTEQALHGAISDQRTEET